MAAAVEAAMAVSSRPVSTDHVTMPTSFNFADLVLPGAIYYKRNCFIKFFLRS